MSPERAKYNDIPQFSATARPWCEYKRVHNHMFEGVLRPYLKVGE